jgi:Ca2+-binding RTX toxin-like protein
MNNEIYINFHTSVFPGGEIRGQAFRQDPGADLIDLRGAGIGDMTTLQQFMSESGGNTTISMMWNGQASSFVLQGVSMARLTAADFLFTDASSRGANGSAGADDVLGAAGSDVLNGNAGNDRIWAGAGNDVLDGGTGNDDVRADAGNDVATGGEGADTVRGMDGDDTVTGGQDNDMHVNGNAGNDEVRGGDGADTVYGGRGNDSVYGDDGADWLSGDLGNDMLTGGGGADRFLFRTGSGADTVMDFNFTEGDRVQLAMGTTYTQSGGVITLTGGDTLTLMGASGFTADWVVFA